MTCTYVECKPDAFEQTSVNKTQNTIVSIHENNDNFVETQSVTSYHNACTIKKYSHVLFYQVHALKLSWYKPVDAEIYACVLSINLFHISDIHLVKFV